MRPISVHFLFIIENFFAAFESDFQGKVCFRAGSPKNLSTKTNILYCGRIKGEVEHMSESPYITKKKERKRERKGTWVSFYAATCQALYRFSSSLCYFILMKIQKIQELGYFFLKVLHT